MIGETLDLEAIERALLELCETKLKLSRANLHIAQADLEAATQEHLGYVSALQKKYEENGKYKLLESEPGKVTRVPTEP